MKKIVCVFISILTTYNVFAQSKTLVYDSGVEDSPWGIASGAEWSGDYPKFNPMLKEAGITWLRYFPEWHSLQPEYQKWNWKGADCFVLNCRTNGIQLSGAFAYFATWASADGSTRTCPVKDVQYWRDYIQGVTERYQNDVTSWEVWNEFNGSFSKNGTPEIYAEMVKEAYITTKKVNPKIKIGMSCANFDIGFFDAAIKAGASGHFDFIAVHPYENLASVMRDGGESGYLSMAGSIRKMLKDNNQRDDIELWITEIGYQAPIIANIEKDNLQAEALVKTYILAIAQGFKRICWFEARGPAYGNKTDHGIVRRDWTPRPAYYAMKTMTGLLGKSPKYLGWLETEKGAYGFVFQGKSAPVLVAWAPINTTMEIKFNRPVKIQNITGQPQTVNSNEQITLTRVPIFIYNLPVADVQLAKSNSKKPFPWGTDYAQHKEVSCLLGATNTELGIKQVNNKTTRVAHGLTESWRISNFKYGGEGRYVYFRTDPTFASFGNKELEITVIAKRVNQQHNTSVSLLYESLSGYKNAKGRFNIPVGDNWTTHTWKVDDANFVGAWGWNFRTDSSGSAGEIAIKEVKVKRISGQ